MKLILQIAVIVIVASGIGHSVAQEEDGAALFDEAVALYWTMSSTPLDRLAAFDRVLEAAPDNVDALAYRSTVYRILRDFERAENDIAAALTLNPESALAYSMRGRLRMEQQRSGEGLADLQYAVSLDPNDSVIHYNLGKGYQVLERHLDAMEAFATAIKIYPTRPDYHSSHFGSYQAFISTSFWGDDSLAILEFESQIPWELYYRANLLRREGPGSTRFHEALEAIDQSILLDSNNAHSFNLRGTLHLLNSDYRLALADFDQALSFDPLYYDAMANKALALASLGDYDEAFDLVRRVGVPEPTFAFLFYMRGIVMAESQMYDSAVHQYQLALQYDPTLHQAALNLGNLYKQGGEYGQALAHYNLALTIWPQFALAYNARAVLNGDLGNWEAALPDNLRAVALQPYVALFWTNLGITYERLEDYQNAVNSYSRAIELDRFNGWAYNGRAQAGDHLDGWQLVEYDTVMACALGVPDGLICP